MKKQLIFLFILLTGGVFAQQTPEFSFELFFEDAIGNKDTITLGYDKLATQGLDIVYDEENIISPWTGPLDVRASNFVDLGLGSLPSYYTKKQIIKKKCSVDLGMLVFDAMFNIYAEHLPITVKWNKSKLSLQCNVLTAYSNQLYEYNSHWGAPNFMSDSINIFFSDTMFFHNFSIDSIIIEQEPPNYSTYSSQGKEIIVGRISFSTAEELPTVGLNDFSDVEPLKIYPNPVSDYLNLIILEEDLPLELVVFSADGRFILNEQLLFRNNLVDIKNLKSGVYFIKLLKDNQLFLVKKIIKY